MKWNEVGLTEVLASCTNNGMGWDGIGWDGDIMVPTELLGASLATEIS